MNFDLGLAMSSDVVTTILVIMSEAAVLLLVIFLIMMFVDSRRKNKHKNLLRRLVDMLHKREPVRLKQLQALLMNNQKLEETAAEAGAKKVQASEKAVYNKILKILLKMDSEVLLSVNQDVEGLLDHYQRAINDGVGIVNDFKKEEASANSSSGDDELEYLKGENQRLEGELADALNTLESIMKEYTSMYTSGGAKKGSLESMELQVKNLNERISRKVELPDVEQLTIPENLEELLPDERPEPE